MTAKLIGNNHDGANYQAQAVLAMVRYRLGDGIESSWCADLKSYTAEPQVHRFDNRREQGYVVYMLSADYARQINIAFYEHRNSDSIYVQVNQVRTLNAPTLEVVTEGMSDKYQSAFSAGVGEIDKVAEFVEMTLVDFWKATAK